MWLYSEGLQKSFLWGFHCRNFVSSCISLKLFYTKYLKIELRHLITLMTCHIRKSHLNPRWITFKNSWHAWLFCHCLQSGERPIWYWTLRKFTFPFCLNNLLHIAHIEVVKSWCYFLEGFLAFCKNGLGLVYSFSCLANNQLCYYRRYY